jgi:hypothetical protein
MRSIALTALLVAATSFASCSNGGGTTGGLRQSCSDANTQALCLVACNLGCSQAGCSLTEIAQNQPLIFNFNQPIDPASVSTASISIKTSSGEEPVGQYLTNGTVVTFVPDLLVQGGQSFFGFRANETYVVTIAGGDRNPNLLRSTSGDVLPQRFTCNLTVSRGVIDLDGNPPQGSLITPSSTTNVPRNTPIVVEFSEIIDATPFLRSTPQDSPIRVRLRRTISGQNGAECNSLAEATLLPGTWRVVNDTARQRSVATFGNTAELPSNICVQVEITNSIRDLAGTAALPQTFQFITAAASQTLQSRVEDFRNDLQLERSGSSGTWGGNRAVPGQLGGSGILGDFDVRFGRETAPNSNIYEWDTTNQLIPQSATLTGEAIRVTNGVFEFATFRLPREATLRFIGTIPPRILIRGAAEVEGKIVLSGANLPEHNSVANVGQIGGAGGPGGARGGNGANKGSGTGHTSDFNGRDGENIALPAGHAYANRIAGTGGKGSVQFPLDGLNASITYGFFNIWSMQTSAGGGGGGYMTAGLPGVARTTYANNTADLGPPAPGGVAFDPFPLPTGVSTLDHFLIGGSGGGGSGSNPFNTSTQPPTIIWRSGSGGLGGGGAIAIRCGGDFQMGEVGLVESRGGSGFQAALTTNFPVGGGGGSGGSVILQIGGSPIMGSSLGVDVRGGIGGNHNVPATFNLSTGGGTGAPGYIRLETTGTPSPGLLGSVQPPATAQNVATLRPTDRDAVSGQQSKWYSTNQVFAPEFVRYEVEATVNGNPIKFSDDPAIGVLATDGQAIRFFVQGATLDEAGVPDPNSIRPWRRYVGPYGGAGQNLNDDGRVGFRFLLLFDRAIAGEIVVTKVSVFYRA